jgi:hypothetical protein
MPKTAVGLFETPDRLDDVVRDIEALGFPRNEIRTLEEPKAFDVTGVMSFPRIDFEVDLIRSLERIGASEASAQAYRDGMRRGGALVFATGSDDKVTAAADIMNRSGAVKIEQDTGPEPQLPHSFRANMTPMRDSPIVAGRIMQPSDGACFFVW